MQLVAPHTHTRITVSIQVSQALPCYWQNKEVVPPQTYTVGPMGQGFRMVQLAPACRCSNYTDWGKSDFLH